MEISCACITVVRKTSAPPPASRDLQLVNPHGGGLLDVWLPNLIEVTYALPSSAELL